MIPDTSSAPYFDDYDPSKNFAKILFKPGFPVQTRELNQLQTLLQAQIERFGNKVLKQGTVVSGCQVTSAPSVPYVKLKDSQTNGKPLDVTLLSYLYVKNASNTVAIILAGGNGTESSAPDLNTLYIRYINSGNNGTTSTFAANEQLTIYNPSGSIERVVINSGAAGFSPTDQMVFLSAAKVANSSGGSALNGISVGDLVADGNGANVYVQTIKQTANGTIVNFRPQVADRIAGNDTAWTLKADASMISANTGATFTIRELIGSGASANIAVNGIGEISTVTMTSKGSGYTELPTVFPVSSSATTAQHTLASFSPESHVAKISVSGALTSPIGYGYGITIDEGIIYQSGYFTRTDKQFLIISKYSTSPAGISVGFDTTGEVVTWKDDVTLLDNQLGTPNYTAPGADRLKVTAKAIVLPTEEAATRSNFLSIVDFSEGEPFQQDTQTQSELLDQYMARRTYEESGNYVVDPFIVTTSSSTIDQEPSSFKIAVDPGTGYINGYRVSTQHNLLVTTDKATTTKTATDIKSSASYGNYIVCTNVLGVRPVGTQVTLRSAAYTGLPGVAIVAPGSVIGNAYIRGIQKINNSFRVYLYDVQMNAGQKLADVRAIFATDFVANVDTSIPIQLAEAATSQSIFKLPVEAAKTVTNTTYQYQKTSWGTVTANTTGFVTLTLSASEEAFPVAGLQGTSGLAQIYISPVANLVANATLAGTITATNGSNTVTGTSSSYLTDLVEGGYVQLANTTANVISRVVSIANNTSFVVSPASTINLTGGTVTKAFPSGYFASIASANVSSDRKTMTISLGANIGSANVVAIATVERTPTVASKTVTRNAAVRINTSNNVALNTGPWALGMSDVIRLRGVYKGSNATFTSAQGVDVSSDFYIDANQTPDYLGTSYLYKKPSSQLSLTTEQLLVVFDVLRKSSSEVITLASYPINDALPLANSAATINTLELPEIFGSSDRYFDTRDCYDFRPSWSNTVAVVTTQSTAPVNPTEPAYSARYAASPVFPAPSSDVSSTIAYYASRYDRIVVTAAGGVKTLTGTPGQSSAPAEPDQSFTINELYVPPYPSLASYLSSDMLTIANTNIASEKYATRRIENYTVKATYTPVQIAEQQPRGYTMRDIGSIDRRLGQVEYYLALSLAEVNTGKRTIPSAVNTSSDRFKFGYFTDSFADDTYADINNPQYTASIAENVVQPVQNKYVISLDSYQADQSTDGFVSAPFNEFKLLGQTAATDGPVIIPEPPVVEPPVVEPEAPVIVVPADPVPDSVTPDPVPTPTPDPIVPTPTPVPEPTPTVTTPEPGPTEVPTPTPTVTTPTPEPQPEPVPTPTPVVNPPVTNPPVVVVDVFPTTPTPVDPPYVEPPVTPAPIPSPVFSDISKEDVVQRTARVVCYEMNRMMNPWGLIREEREYFLSQLPGSCEFYFNARDNQTSFDFYQGTTPGFSYVGMTPIKTTLAAQPLTGDDSYNIDKALGLHTKNEYLDAIEYINGFATVEDAGKILFNWDPSAGRYLKIVVGKFKNSGAYKSGKYSYRFSYPTDDVYPYVIPQVPAVIDYTGTFNKLIPAALDPYLVDTAAAVDFVLRDQPIACEVSGLKPSTVHAFTFGGETKSSSCAPAGGQLGQTLITDSEGKLSFVFYNDRNNGDNRYGQPLSRKAMTLTDNYSSFASCVIEVKPWVAAVASNTALNIGQDFIYTYLTNIP